MIRIPTTDSHVWSLLDQALVSGSNFLTGIVLARTLGIEDFGIYVVAQMYLLYANTFQSSLVATPMMTAVPSARDRVTQNEMLSGFLGLTLLVMLTTVIGVQLLTRLLGFVSPHLGVSGLYLPLAAAMVAFQIQDWSRRGLLVNSNNRPVFFFDTIAYGGQLIALVCSSMQSQMRPERALWVMAVTFSTSALLTLYYVKIWPNASSLKSVVLAHWRAGRDLFATWQLQWVASQGVILLGTGMVGPQAAGAIRAAQNLLGPITVISQWMDNVIPVRAAVRFRDWGLAALVSYLGRIAWIGILCLSIFTSVMVFADEYLVSVLYGESFRPFAILVVFQALYYLFMHGYRVISYFYRAIGNTQVLARASFWWAVVAVAFALVTANWLAERGIMLSLVVGEGAALIYLLWLRPAPREAGANTAFGNCKPAYIILRRSDGSPHLILPCRSLHVLNSALRMYGPSRWTGQLYRASLARTLPWRARFGWVESAQYLAPWCPDLAVILAAVPGASIENIGILVGAPGPLSKLTLKLMNDQGIALAYVRIANLPDAARAIRQECAVLSALRATAVGGQIPRVLACGELISTTGYFLVQSAGPEAAPVRELGEAHFAFLAGLVGKNTIAWATAIDQVEAETKSLLATPTYAGVVASTIAALRVIPGPALFMAVQHGDFAPWNIHPAEGGNIFVFDWEHARLDGLPWQDALHFSYQWAALVQRQGPKQVLATLRGVFKLAAAISYANGLPQERLYTNELIMTYLLRMLVAGATQGKASTSQEQLLCLDVLKMLLMNTRK